MFLEMLHQASGLTFNQLEHLAETASRRYKVFDIPKKNGGTRKIEQPSRAIKAIQRLINKFIISRFPVHNCATAYSKGSSIRDNASRHVTFDYTVRIDFTNFFPSFADHHVANFLRDHVELGRTTLSHRDIDFVRRIVCRNGALTIGAPSSPPLTNAMMYDFDTSLHQWSYDRGVIYTRYADDLFVSSDNRVIISDFPRQVQDFASRFRYGDLLINNEKTAFLSRKHRRSITGIIITPDYKMSIGLDRKNKIKSEIYSYTLGRLNAEDESRVGGFISFIKDVEPTFYDTLCRKYGHLTVETLEGRKPDDASTVRFVR